MLRPMTRIAVLFALPCLVSALTPVATAQRTLAELERRFRDEVQQLAATSPSREQRQQQLDRHVERLRAFVADEAQGDDRWNGRLMLADLELARGGRDAAAAALRGIDAAAAPGMVLVTAAAMAQHLQLTEQRDAWVAAAVGKDAPLPERLAMARLLMTVLGEITHGEAIFAKALQGADDDEQRAYVRWHRADALRDREDLPENTAFDELEALARDLPDTYWGGVAKDRLRATRIAPGDPAIDFRCRTLDGDEVTLAGLRGKAVVLAFWTAADFDTPRLVALLEELQARHADLAVLGICLDRDPEEIRRATRELGIEFPVVGDGKGPENDAALRWFVEGPVVHVVDKQGKVAGLGLIAGTADGRAELSDVVARAVR